jgi:DNA-binding NarL/FixJ family response regulator
VSDRWHLVKNLAACVSVQLAQSLADLRRAEQVRARAEQSTSEERRPVQTRAVQHAQLARQAERTARYEHIMALQKQGVKSAEIALQLGVTQRTMRAMARDGRHPLLTPSQAKTPSH